MGWDIGSVKAEETFYFERVIPKDSNTWVKIATGTPLVDRTIEGFLSQATLTYADAGITNEWRKNWEELKYVACEVTFLECNFVLNGEDIFPKRSRLSQPLKKGSDGQEFRTAWAELRPSTITDEWMSFFLRANPEWFLRLKDLWVLADWRAKWLGDWKPESLGEESKD